MPALSQTTVCDRGRMHPGQAGLGWAAKHIPIGTSYAVWVGIGAALTVAYAMATGAESISVGMIIFISGIIAAVIGLKLVPHAPRTDTGPNTK